VAQISGLWTRLKPHTGTCKHGTVRAARRRGAHVRAVRSHQAQRWQLLARRYHGGVRQVPETVVDIKPHGRLRRAHVLETCMPAPGLQMQLDGEAKAVIENQRSPLLSLSRRLMLGTSAPRSHSASWPRSFICVSDMRCVPSRSQSIAKFVGSCSFATSSLMMASLIGL